MKPGLHLDVPMADYLAMPAVSASLISTLVEQCEYAAWFRSWMNPQKATEDDLPAVLPPPGEVLQHRTVSERSDLHRIAVLTKSNVSGGDRG